MVLIDRQIVGKSHARLAATLAGLTDAVARRPSLLPAWTVGHVLTHLARNADSFVRLLLAAADGRVADQYAGGNDQRAADIDAGAGRPAAELVADVTATAARLEHVWDATPQDAWATGRGRMVGGLCPIAELPFRRWREVELHHVDLGLGYGADSWPDGYVEEELARALARLPGRMPAAERSRLLAWLVGRGGAPQLPDLTPWTG